MLYIEQDTLLKPHVQRVEELEFRAGIREHADRAREGSIFPLGIGGENVEPDAYFADESDSVRRGIRRIYFAVEDIDVRRELIAATREIERLRRDFAAKDLQEAAQEVVKAKASLRRLPWGTGAFMALACVVLGSWLKGEAGAIGGGVFGLFMGLGYVWNRKGEVEAEVEQAEKNLTSIKRDQVIQSLHPETFNASEQSSGERDGQFDSESAYANVFEYLQKNPG